MHRNSFPMKSFVDRKMVLVVGAAVVLGFAGYSLTSWTAAEPSGPGEASARLEAHHFENLSRMVATSDLVVAGTVTNVSDGRIFDDEFRFLNIDFEVDEVIYRSHDEYAGDTSISIEVEASGSPYDPDWREPGTRVLAFLVSKEASGVFREVNSQGYYIIDQSNRVVATTATQQGLTSNGKWSEVRSEVSRAARDVRAGRIEPQDPGMHPGPMVRPNESSS